jgi:subtilase family serine protease
MRSSTARRTVARRALVTLGAAVLTVPFVASSAFSAPVGARAALAGSTPAWAHTAPSVGAPSASTRISFNVVLPLRDAAGAEKVALAVSDPKSKDYGHYLTASAFNAKFAPTADSVAKVESYLKSVGITVSGVAQGNRWVTASGTVAQVDKAFQTTMRNYSYKGHTLRAPSSAVSVPANMAGLISGIVGLAQDGALRKPSNVRPNGGGVVADATSTPSASAPTPSTCSTYWDQHEQTVPEAYGKTSFPTNNCGYTPAQLRTAYGVQSAVSSGNDGHGVTVAIVDAYASPTMLSDANAYATAVGDQPFKAGQYTETTFGPFNDQDLCAGEAGWNGEETLDVEAVHGMAPGADIHYVGAQNCDTGIDDAVNWIIQNQVANIVSNSYSFAGEDGLGDEVATEHSEWIQAATEGIGFYFSSGDQGDNVILGAPHPEPDYPTSDPLVTGVGGTDLAVNSNNSYKFETGWGDSLSSVDQTTWASYLTPPPGNFIFGAGGGVSALFGEPAYQKLAVPSKLAKSNHGKPMRVVPDISALGDPETGFLIGESNGAPFGLSVIGGTSLACPVIAGIQALASQGRPFPIGFANPLLYTLNLSGVAFHDVKPPSSPVAMSTISGRSLLTLDHDSSLSTAKGYDDVTGLGSPNGSLFLLGEKLLP